MYKAIFFAVSQKTTKEKSTQDGLANRFRIYEKRNRWDFSKQSILLKETLEYVQKSSWYGWEVNEKT